MQNKEKANLLLVDDQEPFYRLINRYFAHTDYTMDYTSNPEEVEKMIENKEYDLVILDVMMPKVSGFELCKNIRKTYTMFELPILFLSARNESQNIAEGFICGGNDYVSKPFEASELIARVQTLVRLKKLYKANRLLNKELEERNRFLQMNIHDLKSPLTTIMVLAGLVQKDLQEDEENYNNLDIIIKTSEKMLHIVNEILEFNKLGNQEVDLKFEVVNFDEILAQVLDVQKPLAQNKNQELIIIQTTDKPIKLKVDSEKVVRAVNNILGNAIKYTPKDKKIQTLITTNSTEIGNFLRLEISDTGPGFKENEIDKVFTTFGKFSAQPTGGETSSGLGLMIAKQLIELNNGKIWLDKDYKDGSKFVIELPIVNNNENLDQ